MSKQKDQTAQALCDIFGGAGRSSWYGDITDALFAGLNQIAKSIQGQDERGCLNRETSLCRSFDGIADAINNLAEAVRETKKEVCLNGKHTHN